MARADEQMQENKKTSEVNRVLPILCVKSLRSPGIAHKNSKNPWICTACLLTRKMHFKFNVIKT